MPEPESAFERETKEVKDFVKLLGTTVSGGLAAVGAVAPLAGFIWQTIAPPWPPASPVIPAMFSLMTVVAMFLTFRASPEADARRWSKRLWITGLVLGTLYLYLAAEYVDAVDGRAYLTGLRLTPEARTAVDDPKGPKNVTKDLLDYFGYSSEDRIWEGRSFLKWLMLVLCCFASASFAGGLSLLLVATIIRNRAMPPLGPLPGPPSGSPP